jgi:hypothetical protein
LSFSFAQVEAALAHAHAISDGKRSAFANRIKHMQKLGFLPEIRTGRGQAANYKGHHAFLIGVALQFIEFGLTPERVITFIQKNMGSIINPARMAVPALNSGNDLIEPFYVIFDPSALSYLRFDNAADDNDYAALTGMDRDTVTRALSMPFLIPRTGLINITAVVSDIFTGFHALAPIHGQAFEDDLITWLATWSMET